MRTLLGTHFTFGQCLVVGVVRAVPVAAVVLLLVHVAQHLPAEDPEALRRPRGRPRKLLRHGGG